MVLFFGSLSISSYPVAANADTASGNLVLNGGFEVADGNLPMGWQKEGYGTNVRSFVYPAYGRNSEKAALVRIETGGTGDAKWVFRDVPVIAGKKYTYSDYYRSSVPSYLTARYKHSNGQYSYEGASSAIGASQSWKQAEVSFIPPPGTVSMTVFHSISSVGYLVIDDVRLAGGVSDPNALSYPLISLTFDDGLKSHYDVAYPALKDKGLTATFFVSTKHLHDFGFRRYMSLSDVYEIRWSGFEIGAHTRTHARLSALSGSELWSEIYGSRRDLADLGVGPILSFAYTYGDFDSETLRYVKEARFRAARTTLPGFADLATDPYRLPRMSVDRNTTLAEVDSWIDTARSQNKWLILNFHGIDRSGDKWSITPEMFDRVIDKVSDSGIAVVNISGGFRTVYGPW